MSMMGSSSASARPSNVKFFLRADSAEELVRLQLENNVRLQGQAFYTDITFANGSWYAWFLVDLDKHPELVEGINGLTQSSVRQRTR